MSVYIEHVLTLAAGYIGLKGGAPRHTGPEIDAWLNTVGLSGGYPWCAAFVHAMFEAASTAIAVPNPCPRTASALHLWSKAQPTQHTHAPARGRVFVVDHGHGLGHCGFVELVNDDGTITTLEGDTDAAGSRTGDGVGRHTWDPTDGRRGTLVGFCDFEPVVDAPALTS